MCLAVQLGRRRYGAGGIVGEERRYLQRHPAIHAAGQVVDRAEEVSGAHQVIDRELEEQRLTRFALDCFPADGVVVGVAILDGVIEDRRVGGQSGHRQLADIALQGAVVQDAPGDVVEPEALTEIVQLSRGVHSCPCY